MEHIVRSSSCALFDFHETPGGHFRCAASFFLFHFPLHFVSFVLLFLLLLRLLLLLFMHLFIYLSGCSFYYSFLSFFYVWIWKELVDKIPLIIDWNTTADLLLVSAVKEGRTPTWRYDHKRLFDDDNFPSVAVDIFFPHLLFIPIFTIFICSFESRSKIQWSVRPIRSLKQLQRVVPSIYDATRKFRFQSNM